MITIESTESEIRVSIPRADLDPVSLERLLLPLRFEAAAAGSRMTEAQADKLAEEMKSDWWLKNKSRFLPATSA